MAVELKKVYEAIYALHRLFDIKGKDYAVDIKVFGALTKMAIEVIKSRVEEMSQVEKGVISRLEDSTEKVLERATSLFGNNADLWGLSALLNEARGKKEAIEFRMKQCRSLKVSGWESEREKFVELSDACCEMMQTTISFGDKNNFYSARSFVKIIIAKTKTLFGDSIEFLQLENSFQKLQEREREVQGK